MRIALRSAVVALLVASVVSACDEENPPTGPSSDDPALAETNSICGPAPSEFVRSYDGDAESLLLTFEIDSDENVCYLDMTSEGIFFGGSETDTIDVWVMKKQGGHVSNVPSGERYAMSNENYWGTIVFDPPIQELSFFYTEYNGLRVTVYNQYGWFIQQDSLPLTDNNSDWDPYTVSVDPAGSERIGKVFLDYWDEANTGNFRLDDMEIIREATLAGVECNPVTRGQITTCALTDGVDSVLAWSFQGEFPDGSDQVTIEDSINATEWSGTSVISGTVTASVVIDGQERVLGGDLDVGAREWRWDEANWNLQRGIGDCEYQDATLPGPADFGRNRTASGCEARRIDPDMWEAATQGYEIGQVPEGGPNGGLWYVTAGNWGMDHMSSVNPYVMPGGPVHQLTHKPNLDACGFGKKEEVSLGFYDFNASCTPVQSDAFIDAVWAHEEFGTNGGVAAPEPNGHEARARKIAGTPAYDPYRLAEMQVRETDLLLRQAVENGVQSLDNDIREYAADHDYVTDNYLVEGSCGTIWLYDTSKSRWTEVEARHADTGNCI